MFTVAVFVGATLMKQLNIQNRAKIETIGLKAYFEPECINEVTYLNWDIIEQQKNYTIYLKNIGLTNITLTMTTTEWNPINVSNYVSVTWNYNNETLTPNEVLQVTFTFTVTNEQAIVNEQIRDISWTITITAIET